MFKALSLDPINPETLELGDGSVVAWGSADELAADAAEAQHQLTKAPLGLRILGFRGLGFRV